MQGGGVKPGLPESPFRRLSGSSPSLSPPPTGTRVICFPNP